MITGYWNFSQYVLASLKSYFSRKFGLQYNKTVPVPRLVPHVKELLYPFQHGFQKGRSRVAQLLEAFYDISGALDRGIETDIIYLDFAKAFDSVCPAKLVSKLSTFGIKTLY